MENNGSDKKKPQKNSFWISLVNILMELLSLRDFLIQQASLLGGYIYVCVYVCICTMAYISVFITVGTIKQQTAVL